MKTIDWGQTGDTMDESGAHDTRRGARRLARFPLGSAALAYAMHPRFWNTVAPWPARQRDTRDRPGHGASAEGHEKTAAPVRGRAVSGSWYHPSS